MSERKKRKLSKHAEALRLDACIRCGYSREAHALVNFADGPIIGRTELICPTVIYKPLRDVLADEGDLLDE